MTQREQKSSLAAGSVSPQTVTLSSVVAGRLILVGVFAWTDGTSGVLATTATDNQGNTLARDSHAEVTNASDRWMVAVYSIILPASYATYTVSVSITSVGANAQYEVAMLECSPTTSWSAFDQQASSTSATAVTSGNSGTTAANGANTRLAIAVFALGNGAASNTITQNGGANWPTAATNPDTDGETVQSSTNNSTAQAGMISTSINTAHQSATSTDSWTFSSGRYAACIATYAEVAASAASLVMPHNPLAAMVGR